MGLTFRNLDPATRTEMLGEIRSDIKNDRLYTSDNLSPQGRSDYAALLEAAATNGSDDSLSAAILSRLNTHEKPRTNKKTGTVSTPVMRVNAHTMMTEGEFNRFYMRGVCARAIATNDPFVTVYRAKVVETPRPESEAKLGTRLSAVALLADLRKNIGLETHLGLAGPNSGLSVHL